MKQIFTAQTNSTLTLIAVLITFGMSLTSLYFIYIERREDSDTTVDLEPIITPEGLEEEADILNNMRLVEARTEALLQQSENNLERSSDAINAADLVLSFLEGASVLAGIILVGAGIFGVVNVQDLRNDTTTIKAEIIERLELAERDLTERVERAQRELQSKSEQLEELEAQLEAAIERNQDKIDQQIEIASKEARSAFEALSHHIMAQRLARENNIDAAIHACRDAHDLDPDNVPNNYLLGTLLIKKNIFEEAIEHLTEAFNEAREDSEEASAPSQAALGLAIRKKGDHTTDLLERNRLYNQAEYSLLEATRHDPHLLTEDHESYFGVLGSLYRRQGRTQDAIEAYRRAADMTPRRSYPQINLAMLYLAINDLDNSERYRQFAELNSDRRLADTPEDYWAKHDLALAVLMRNEVQRATDLFEDAADLSPNEATLDSVSARLEYLKSIRPDMPGLAEALDVLEKAHERFRPLAEFPR